MGEPTKPNIPDDAPQDVKDFFDCKGDKLVWKKGKVTWLGLPVDPDVSFEHGKAKDSIDITITFGKPPLGVSFTLNASVNSDGELTVDSTSLPDLSSISDKLPGKNDFDNSIKNINAWFKKNGKKLKGATLKKGEITLEKTTTTGTYAPPAVAPFDDDDLNKPQNVGLKPGWETGPDAGAWDSAVAQTTVGPAPLSTQSDAASPGLSLLTMLALFGFAAVAALGLGIGFLFFAGAPVSTSRPTLVAAASPSPEASAPASQAVTPATTIPPTESVVPTAAQSIAPPTEVAVATLEGACIQVHHIKLGNFVSYLDVAMLWSGLSFDHLEATILGANDDKPGPLAYEPATGEWRGLFGLHEPGVVTITKVVAVLADGSTIDVTQDLIDFLATDALQVRYPQEDSFGSCPSPSP